jgi:hypothetical protein
MNPFPPETPSRSALEMTHTCWRRDLTEGDARLLITMRQDVSRSRSGNGKHPIWAFLPGAAAIFCTLLLTTGSTVGSVPQVHRILAPFPGHGWRGDTSMMDRCGSAHIRSAPQLDAHSGRTTEVAGISERPCGALAPNANDSWLDMDFGLTTSTIVLAKSATSVFTRWNLSYDYSLFAKGSNHTYAESTIDVSLNLWVINSTSNKILADGGWSGPYVTAGTSSPTGQYRNGSAAGARESTVAHVNLSAGSKVTLIIFLDVRLNAFCQGIGTGISYAHWNIGYGGNHARLVSLAFS